MNDRAADIQLVNTSISASAGSGKTFQLTNRYLQLVTSRIAAPGTILASTFTRLAAGEIRDRILTRLTDAIDDDRERAELAVHLAMPDLRRDDLAATLRELARNLHTLQIRTLDSFFASVVKTFAIELGLPLDAEVIDEHQDAALRAQAIRRMLDERQPQDLIDLLRLLTQGSSDRAVTKTIDATVTGLYGRFREAPPTAWECVPQLTGRLNRNELVDAIRRVESLEIPSVRKQIRSAWRADVDRARRHDWREVLSKGLGAKIAVGDNTFGKKAIDPEIVEAYTPLVQHAAAEMIHRLREQTIATRDMLRLFHLQYERLKHERRVLTFEDITVAMARAEELGKLDEIGFRLDARIHHLLLDEFQDTSIRQWRALEPIARELVSNAPPQRTFFCVGDVKQSIYGWRDAAPELFEELPHLLTGPGGDSAITVDRLSRSYRSSPIIIDAVNRVFESIPQNQALSDFPEVALQWSSGFRHHDTAKKDLSGYAELRIAKRPSDSQKNLDVRLEAAAELAAELHNRNPHMRIAVLTRTNAAVARVLYEFNPLLRNVPAGGRGGGPLTDAPAVNAVLDLLRLADHPDDTVAAFNVAMSPLGEIIELTDFRDQHRRRTVAHQVRRLLLQHGYAATIAQWTARLADACDERELRRTIQLVELAGLHDSRPTLRTADFIRVVEQADIAATQPASIQVMTIHQSKGLEFDAVILPELSAPLIGRPGQVVFDREGETGPIQHVCRYANKRIRAFVRELEPLFDRHRRRAVRESLSLLYVGMTRAIHGLYMIIDPPETKENKIPARLDGVLRCALADAPVVPDSVVYSHGNVDWCNDLDGSSAPTSEPLPPVQPIRLARTSDPTLRGLGAEPATTAADRFSLASRLILPSTQARDRGIAIHALFQQIEWLDDFTSDAAELHRIVRAKAPRRDTAWVQTQVDSFGRMLAQPAIRQALSKPAAGHDTFHVHRELPFARLVHGRVQTGFVDRLVLRVNAAGLVCSAMIIDFKTDPIEAQSAADVADRYRPQLDTYRAAVSELFEIDESGVQATLLLAGVDPAMAITL